MMQLSKIDEIFDTMPSLDEIHEIAKKYQSMGCLLLLDDVMGEKTFPDTIQTIFTEICHHYSMTCLLLDLFFNNAQFCMMRINSSYIIVFKNPGDKRQISTLAYRYSPLHQSYLIEMFRDATKKAHSNLVLDHNGDTII